MLLTMLLSALSLLGVPLWTVPAASYVVAVGAHPAWNEVSNGGPPSLVRMKKCIACQTIWLPNLAPHNPRDGSNDGGGGGGGVMNHPTTRQGLFASVLRNLMPRDRLHTSYYPPFSSVEKLHPTLEKKEDQPKFTDKKMHKLFVGLKLDDGDKSISGAKSQLPSTEKFHILKCLLLHQYLQRIQRISSKVLPNPLIIRKFSSINSNDNDLQNLDDIRKQIEIYCKHPKTIIKDKIRELIDARIRSKNGTVVAPELLRHEAVNLTTSQEDSVRSNNKQSFQKTHLSPPKPIDAAQSETKDKINMKITSTYVIIPSTPTTVSPLLSKNLLPGSTATTANWVFNETVGNANSELDRVTSSTDEPYLHPTTLGNSGLQTAQTDFVDVNADLKLDMVTQDSSSTTGESYIYQTTEGNNDFQTVFTELKPTNATAGRLLQILPGRILFLYKDQTIPMLLVRTENGTTVLAIDGDYLCNRIMDDPQRYETKFSKLCFSI